MNNLLNQNYSASKRNFVTGFMAYGNKCYWFNSGSDNTVSWYDTIDLCGELSAEPATIQNTYEQVEYLFVLHSNMKSNLLLYSLYYAEA